MRTQILDYRPGEGVHYFTTRSWMEGDPNDVVVLDVVLDEQYRDDSTVTNVTGPHPPVNAEMRVRVLERCEKFLEHFDSEALAQRRQVLVEQAMDALDAEPDPVLIPLHSAVKIIRPGMDVSHGIVVAHVGGLAYRVLYWTRAVGDQGRERIFKHSELVALVEPGA